MSVQINIENQTSPVADDVSALIAIVCSSLRGILFSLKQSVVEEAGGIEKLKLFMLSRIYKHGDGDCGICFEYAIHDAILRQEPSVIERVYDSLVKCGVPGRQTASILFGAEKSKALQIVGNMNNLLTDESRLLTGTQSQPPKLKKHIVDITKAFYLARYREQLPSSISGLWKADLFIGNTDSDRWVGTTVKINRQQLEGASGLRIGIVPSQYGKGDSIIFDSSKNLVICPIPYDQAFMEKFYSAWFIVTAFIKSDANMPKPELLPLGAHRIVARELENRKNLSVLELIESLLYFAQPGLLYQEIINLNTESITPSASSDLAPNIIAPKAALYRI